MRAAVAVLLALTAPQAAAETKKAPPQEPQDRPDWASARQAAERRLRLQMKDPASTNFEYTSGFQWGWTRLGLRARRYGWVACGTVNARNSFGGYAGPERFFIFINPETRQVEADYAWAKSSICDSGPAEPLQPALIDLSAASAPASVADELAKLAALRDKGVITQAEFDAQKAKLLAK